jgi:tetratricopeptide (TPR) repeat protein
VKATAASITNLEEEEAETVTIYPDQFPIADDTTGNSLLGSILLRRRLFGLRGSQTSSIGNDLRELPNILRQNIFSCILAAEGGEPEPVWSGLEDLIRRVNTIRLRHQADQRGLLWNADIPWILRSREWFEGKPLTEKSKKADASTMPESTMYGNPVDLVPESPSDWIPYDPEMTKSPRPCGPRFNTEDYEDFYWERYSQFRPPKVASETVHSTWTPRTKQANDDDKPHSLTNGGLVSEESNSAVQYDSDHAWNMLHDTALMLKEGGNSALEAGSIMEAARRYDCAINYCSVAFLLHPNANADFISRGDRKWCPLRKVLATCRLNLCMVLSNFDIRGARDQALMALKELAPFCTEEGKVLGGKKLSVVHNPIEPLETFLETKELQAKAYFRLASVNFKAGDYEDAVEKFEESIKCTKALSKEPDRILIRRLGEAKREKIRKNKRQRKKFKRMLAQDASRDDSS